MASSGLVSANSVDLAMARPSAPNASGRASRFSSRALKHEEGVRGSITEDGKSRSGTPSASGFFTFTVTATDAGNCQGTQTYSNVLFCPVLGTTPASSFPDGLFQTAYSQALAGTGGTAPYTFAVTSGSLAPGLTLSSAGALTGTPTNTVASSFTVTVTDVNTQAMQLSGLDGGATGAKTITEGMSGTVGLRLAYDPLTTVTITCAVDSPAGPVSISGTGTYTFTPGTGNWDNVHNINIAVAEDDMNMTTETPTITCTRVSGGNPASIPMIQFTVNAAENDT